MVGEKLSLADLAVAPSLTYLQQAKLPLSQYANLQAWFARVTELEAWKHTMPVW
jgi:glutathione S-transferase